MRGDSRGHEYSEALAGRVLVLSFQTVAELLRWSIERNWSQPRRDQLVQYLQQFVVYPYSFELALEWAQVTAGAARLGRPVSSSDAWIAATARLNHVPLATHNRADFEAIPELEVISFAPVR